ncbi:MULTISPECIES: tRNA epoxyqueuosine(34) reductase QueG [unclassified Moraxella]|uniref:tRNA epoxyqueuosine(34) reductase QueG n=1 Tax=unclassified Moraxella TaxID=2685852 RepID=UPI003AF888EC
MSNSLQPKPHCAKIPCVDSNNAHFLVDLAIWIKQQALELGFADCGFVSPNNPIFPKQLENLKRWLADGKHGEMNFFLENHDKRANPALLVEGTQSIISVRLDYLVSKPANRTVADNDRPNHAIIARYARGRDYHKTMRQRLKTLANRIHDKLKTDYPQYAEGFIFRPFSDSAPIFERALAEQAGLGWTGKHTLLINKKSGSFFVLGELFTSLPLPVDEPNSDNHCGSCRACIHVCPTHAIKKTTTGHYEVDARLCISYLTIELEGKIPVELRPKIGNRVFGCDDCQLICPWNKFVKLATIDDFNPRHALDSLDLLSLWAWDEKAFLAKTEGSPLRRTGYENLMRNVAVALGNAPFSQEIIEKLKAKHPTVSENTQEHIDWAIGEQLSKTRIRLF